MLVDVTFADCCYAEVLLDITCGLGGLYYCIKLNPEEDLIGAVAVVVVVLFMDVVAGYYYYYYY